MQRVVTTLSHTIGLAETLDVLRKWGGRDLSVPRQLDFSHPIALAIGLAAAQRLCAAYGGQVLKNLPLERNALVEVRNRLITEEAGCGHSDSSLGLKYGLHRRTVRLIVERCQSRGETGLASFEPEKAAA